MLLIGYWACKTLTSPHPHPTLRRHVDGDQCKPCRIVTLLIQCIPGFLPPPHYLSGYLLDESPVHAGGGPHRNGGMLPPAQEQVVIHFLSESSGRNKFERRSYLISVDNKLVSIKKFFVRIANRSCFFVHRCSLIIDSVEVLI